ncbi:MAG: hypothetical protein HW380_3191 [Magnetococcales bacterium]|nr:hypothetical protein [Magnetococcales bacterium]
MLTVLKYWQCRVLALYREDDVNQLLKLMFIGQSNLDWEMQYHPQDGHCYPGGCHADANFNILLASFPYVRMGSQNCPVRRPTTEQLKECRWKSEQQL